MNFLAHTYLSGKSDKILIGNFIGDFVKGHAHRDYEPEIQRGILLHREIDAYTDLHPIFRQSKSRLAPNYRHYSGVVVDLFYDHFLARNFNDYSEMRLKNFAQHVYSVLDQNQELVPERVSHMLIYMIRGNWLTSYAEVSGINRALTGMASRTKFESGMEKATQDLEKHYDIYRSEFIEFFPQLVAHVNTWLENHQ